MKTRRHTRRFTRAVVEVRAASRATSPEDQPPPCLCLSVLDRRDALTCPLHD